MYGFIYMTENLINGKKYIGQRVCTNTDKDNAYLGSGTLIRKAIKKYGKENFKRTILEECSTREELNEAERKYIRQYNATENPMFYNIASGGEGMIDPSPELRRILSEAHIGQKHTEEFKQKMSERVRGENHPLYGKKHSEESRKKMSESQLRRNLKGERNPWFGHVYTEEEKARISKALTGRKLPPEVAKKCAEARQIKVLCKTTGVIYPSLQDAARDLNLDVSMISKVCRGKSKQTKGYIFEYIGKPMNKKSRKQQDFRKE